jgi:hypothetical protein
MKCTNIFHTKALQNTPKLGFWLLNHLATLFQSTPFYSELDQVFI